LAAVEVEVDTQTNLQILTVQWANFRYCPLRVLWVVDALFSSLCHPMGEGPYLVEAGARQVSAAVDGGGELTWGDIVVHNESTEG
jgi:hypothetical protein